MGLFYFLKTPKKSQKPKYVCHQRLKWALFFQKETHFLKNASTSLHASFSLFCIHNLLLYNTLPYFTFHTNQPLTFVNPLFYSWALPRPAPRRGGREAAIPASCSKGSFRVSSSRAARTQASSVLSLDSIPAHSLPLDIDVHKLKDVTAGDVLSLSLVCSKSLPLRHFSPKTHNSSPNTISFNHGAISSLFRPFISSIPQNECA